MKAIIYKLESKSGKCYVGSTTTTLKKRIAVHLTYLKKDEHPNFILQKVWNKYGNLKVGIIEEFEYEELQEVIKREQKWLDKLSPAYNLCKKAYVQSMTKEMRSKISNALKGRKHSEARVKAMIKGKEVAKVLAAKKGDVDWGKMPKDVRKRLAKETSIRLRKPVLMFSFEGYVEFPSKKEAALFTGLSGNTIWRCIQKGLPDTKTGTWFMYID